MINSVLVVMRRKAGFISGKVLTEVTGSALAIVAVTTLSAQWKSSVPVEGARVPVYRPTLDPATGKIVDRLSAETSGVSGIGRTAVAAFIAAPNFVAMTSITPWATSPQRAEMTSTVRGHAIGASVSAESQRTTLAGLVPLPPARPAAVKIATMPVAAPSKLSDEPPPSRLERVAGWFSPGRAVEEGVQVLSSSRDAVYSAVSYGGSALSRIYP